VRKLVAKVFSEKILLLAVSQSEERRGKNYAAIRDEGRLFEGNVLK